MVSITDEQIEKHLEKNKEKYDIQYHQLYPEYSTEECFETDHYQMKVWERAKEDLAEEEVILEEDLRSETL